MKLCQHCGSKDLRKRGTLKTKRGKTQRYQCKDCKKTFTKRNGTLNYRHRKQHLRQNITDMYCEGMSLRAIARTLSINYKTVVKYFLENANVSRENNLKRLAKGGIVTTYVQFDELETFEHTKKRPLGVQVSVRAKNGQIISTKVCYIPVKALSVSKSYIEEWNKNINRGIAITDMLLETKKSLNKNFSTVVCDNAKQPVAIAKKIFNKVNIQVYNSHEKNKRIDLAFLRMRQDISRLRRKTLATTKRKERLQKHLDLYTDYHTEKRIA